MSTTKPPSAKLPHLEGEWTPQQVLTMYQELLVHKEELLAQNDELQAALISQEIAEQRLASLFHALPVPYCVINGRGQLLQWNQLFCQTLQRPDQMLFDKPIAAFLTPINTLFQHLHSKGKATSNVLEGDLSIVLPNTRELRPVKVNITQVDDSSGKSYLLTFTDISTEVDANLQLKQVAETRSRFVANMSHEIRTPLHGLLGYLDLALADSAIPEEIRHLLTNAGASAEHLKAVVNDILDYSKLETGAFTLHPYDCDINDLCQSVVDLIRPLAEAKGLSLVSHLSNRPCIAQCDTLRLKQILINLLSNAVKYTQAGSVKLEFDHSASGLGSHNISLAVTDTGIGIDKLEQERLFTPYTRINVEQSRSQEGTGLGLSIVQQLTHLMDGALVFASTPGKGTKVRLNFTFPSAIVDAGTTATGYLSGDLTGLKILFVDDSITNREIGTKMITNLNGCCLLAENGEQAIEMLEGSIESVDLILMDIQMPGMGGEESIRKIRAHYGTQIPVVAMTANATPDDRTRYLSLGADELLGKPFSMDELRRVVNDRLSRHAKISKS